jgi:hypothetical protein
VAAARGDQIPGSTLKHVHPAPGQGRKPLSSFTCGRSSLSATREHLIAVSGNVADRAVDQVIVLQAGT